VEAVVRLEPRHDYEIAGLEVVEGFLAHEAVVLVLPLVLEVLFCAWEM
jgi:hypothetical protein